MLRLCADTVEIFAGLIIEPFAVILQKGKAPAVDATQGGAKVMRNGIGKRRQLLVGCFKLGSAVNDTLLQFGVEFLDFFLCLFALGDVTYITLYNRCLGYDIYIRIHMLSGLGC